VTQGPLKKGTNSLAQQFSTLFFSPSLSKTFICGTEILCASLQYTLSTCQNKQALANAPYGSSSLPGTVLHPGCLLWFRCLLELGLDVM